MELREGWFWKERPNVLKSLMEAFSARAVTGLPGLSMDGNHSFLFGGIRREVERNKGARWSIEMALETHIDERLLGQRD